MSTSYIPAPGTPLWLFIEYCHQFELLCQNRPIDLQYCFDLERRVYEIIGEWLKATVVPHEGLCRGRNYGGAILRILNDTGADKEGIIHTAILQKRYIDDQIKEGKFEGYRTKMTVRQERCLRGHLEIEDQFWEGILVAFSL